MSRVVEGTHASDDVSAPEDARAIVHKEIRAGYMAKAQLIAMMSPNVWVSGACYSVTVCLHVGCRMAPVPQSA